MEPIRQDIRYALRTLRKSTLFTFTVIATLAVGIGANTAIFSFVDVLLLRPLPYGHPDRLVVLWEDFSSTGGPEAEWFTPPDFRDVREQSETLDAVSMFNGWTPNLTGSGEPERLTGGTVSAEYFSLLGVAPGVGRSFTEEDVAAGRPVVVLSDGLWKRTFGGDPALIGTTIMLSGVPHTVLGVMPPDFRAPMLASDLWRPMTPATFSAGCGRACYVMRVLARVAPNATLEQARSELSSIARGIAEEAPGEKAGFVLRAVPLREQLAGQLRPALIAMLGAVGLLLLIACVNIANLLLARSGAREREVAVRAAIGAGRLAIVRQLLTESVVIGLVGGAAGALLAYWGVDVLVAMSPPGTPRLDEVGVDGRVLSFALFLSIATGILFGLAPAIQLSRPNLISALREGGARASGAGGRLRGSLVVAEIAIALTLLVGAGLLTKSFARLQSVDPGFDPANVLRVNLLTPASTYAEPPRFMQFYADLIDRLARRPGVVAVGATTIVPLSGNNTDVSFVIEGRALPQNREETPVAWYRQVTPDYFRAIGMRLIRGRGITNDDREGAPAVVVINQMMARRFWPNEDAIGKRISAEGPEGPWATVVGIVADVRHNGLEQDPLIEMYLPYAQQPARAVSVLVRTTGDPLTFVSSVREEVRALDPQLPVAGITTMEVMVSQAVALPRLYLSFFAFFALVALLLAAIGIYGVTSYAVSQRTQEIGIRMALGARAGDVLKMIVRQSLFLVGLGLLIGLGTALALSRTLTTLLYQLSPTDPATFTTIALVLAAVATLASWMPARRATRVDPAIALRNE